MRSTLFLLSLGLLGSVCIYQESNAQRSWGVDPNNRNPYNDPPDPRRLNPDPLDTRRDPYHDPTNPRSYNPNDRNPTDYRIPGDYRNPTDYNRNRDEFNRDYNNRRGPENRDYNPYQPGNPQPPYGGAQAPRGPNAWDYGDSRCSAATSATSILEQSVSVDIEGTGVVNGRVVYLCDGPDVPDHGRPKPGRTITAFHTKAYVFLGIPYAEPPTYQNNLRFKAPRVKSAFGVIQAFQYKPACPQNVRYYGLNMGIDSVNEDCLYLNIFTPDAKKGAYKKYPVMIYIHGGNWDHGSGNTFPAHLLSASQEVLVVTFNYRLGALGFLATGDSASPGNYGLLDQSMAIQWVYERIEYFNGDPNKITLFGPGAGGASAGLHMLSPRTADVVRRVIAQSGSALADWAFIEDPTFMYNSSRIFGKAVGCTTYSSHDLVECLRTRSTKDLMNIERKPEVGWLLWGPVLDNQTESQEKRFFPKSVESILDDIPLFPNGFAYMGGVTRDEAAAMLLEDEELKKNRFVVTKELFNRKVMSYMKMFNYTLNPEAVYNAISFMYSDFGDPNNATLLRQGYIDMLSDSYYKAPNDKILKKLVRKGVKTYMYVLNYTLEARPQPEWQGVPHDSEYLLITGAPLMDSKFYPSDYKLDKLRWTELDRNMSILFMKSWANFAKGGNPTPEALFNSIKWEPMYEGTLQYLSINTTNETSVMLRDYRQKECQFWSEYLPTLIDRAMPTWPPYLESWEERERRIYVGALYGMVGAAAFLIFLTLLCCCLYCRAKSKHIVEDEGLPGTVSASDSFLGLNVMESKYSPEMVIMNEGAQKHTRV